VDQRTKDRVGGLITLAAGLGLTYYSLALATGKGYF
jgi:hypothetical protein